MKKTTIHRGKSRVKTSPDFTAMSVFGVWMLLTMIGNALTGCWR